MVLREKKERKFKIPKKLNIIINQIFKKSIKNKLKGQFRDFKKKM